MDPAVWIALGGTLFAGAGFKIVEKILGKGKEKTDIASALREEMRTEIKALRDELRLVEKDMDTWRDRYYTLLEQAIAAGYKPVVPPTTLPGVLLGRRGGKGMRYIVEYRDITVLVGNTNEPTNRIILEDETDVRELLDFIKKERNLVLVKFDKIK